MGQPLINEGYASGAQLFGCIWLSYTEEVVAGKHPLNDCAGFDWDEYNVGKNWERHRAASEEAEDVFFHEPLVVRSDMGQSQKEKRYFALGSTAQGRLLFAAFTTRRNLIRIISVRDMNQRERESYDRHQHTN